MTAEDRELRRLAISSAQSNTVVIDVPADARPANWLDGIPRTNIAGQVFLIVLDVESGSRCLINAEQITVVEEVLPPKPLDVGV